MEKKRTKKKRFLRSLALILVSILSCFCLSGCMGMSGTGGSGGGSGSSGGNTGSTTNQKPQFDNPYSGGSEDTITNYNNVFLGAIGVYEIDNTAKVFYDNYSGAYVDFNYLIDRQFEALATVIYNSLHYAYGDPTYVFNGSVNYYGNSVSFAFNNVVKETIYNDANTLKYSNAINGGYAMEKIDTEVDDGQGGKTTVTEFKYSDVTINAYRAWKNTSFTVSQITNQLRYIYANPVSVSTNKDLNLKDINTTLKNKYNGFNGTLGTNESISTIGFTKEYMWNVLYYVAYSLVGEANINSSLDNANIVFNGTNMNTVTVENYLIFDAYKGYDKVLPDLISNCFKLILNGKSIVVGSNYCFDINNYNSFFDKTLFPILTREEYIFFDDVDDICDAEGEKSSDASMDSGKDWSTIDPSEVEEFDPDSVEDEDALTNKTTKVGSLRKIKKIIMIPAINKSKYKKENFSINNLSICFATKSGELEVEILTNIVDQSGKEYLNQQLKYDDGSFSTTLPDGTVVDNNSKNHAKEDGGSNKKDEMVTSSGHLIVQSTPSTNKYSNSATIFKSESDSEDYKFSSVSKEDIIRNSFSNTSYDVQSTGEKIEIGRINVCNQLFTLTQSDTSISKNGVTSTISINSTKNNYIEFVFKYYNKGGSALSYIPELYLLDFSF